MLAAKNVQCKNFRLSEEAGSEAVNCAICLRYSHQQQQGNNKAELPSRLADGAMRKGAGGGWASSAGFAVLAGLEIITIFN